jgi:RNA-binding protein YhbY
LSLGDFADRVNLSNTSTIITRESYAILIEEIDTDSFTGETLIVDLGSVDDAFEQGNKIEESALNKEEGTNSSLNERFTATVRVPQSIFQDDSTDHDQKQRLSYSVFVRGSLFLNQNASQQSIIVGVRVNGTDMVQNPIIVYLQRQEVIKMRMIISSLRDVYMIVQSISNSSGNLTCGRWNTAMHGKLNHHT